MSASRYFAVIRMHGPAWRNSYPMAEQEGWQEHAAFMNRLTREGFVVVGGPLAEGHRVLLVVNAQDEKAIRTRLDEDPWTPLGLLGIASIEPWQISLGGLPTDQVSSEPR